MADITGVTRGGEEYTPKFVMGLDQKRCIGCGRCYKVCARDVFELIERDECDDLDEDDDDFDDDDNSMVMSLKAEAKDCIGCEACFRVCPRQCMTHEAAPIAA